ncbi:hypothetical protein [uncultured Vagococcus sp.]|uniref:hypothetical protein n=1 Tax=uncultured Vagococcus sp. TaxID=189676 RepID=UPI0028D39910|nr:hypothetical protein [uncultured Vagococcus sp.]
MVERFGKDLYKVKADNDMSGLTFILIGLIIGLVANFVFAKTLLFSISVILLLVGWYVIRRFKHHYLIFYTSVIFLKKLFTSVTIDANQIRSIEFKVLPTITKTTIIHYPILVMVTGKRVKLFKIYQGEFKQVLDDYQALHGF